MTTTGAYNYAPSVGELVLNAYARIGIQRPSLVAGHFRDAFQEANLLQVEWANRGVNLWTVDLQSQALTQGTATYSVPSNTIMVLDAYITTGSGAAAFDRIITPISRTEYAALPDKALQAPPTVFWFDRLIAPTITLWATPDGSGPYTLNYYRYRQIQDAAIQSSFTPELPYRFLDAFASGLAARLARMHAPAMYADAAKEAERVWQIAAMQDTENVPIYVIPGLSAYYRY